MFYNYVVFNVRDNRDYKKNQDGYYSICLKDLYQNDEILVLSHPVDYSISIIRVLFDIHHSDNINKIIDLPLKSLWFPHYFKNKFKDNKPLCFVFLDPNINEGYYTFLKTKYVNCKIVAIHRDAIDVWKKAKPHFVKNPVFDLEMSFDPYEAKEYHMLHFDEFESKLQLSRSRNYPESDVFFAGKAKDRLERLIISYDIFTNIGLKCFFYITGVKKQDQVDRKGIVYADKLMPYREMLEHSINSKCLLEINQKGLSGYTSRFLEAVMYNKRLISDNSFIKSTKFYNNDYIQVIDDVNYIDPTFAVKETPVDYGYNDEFSPIHLIDQIDHELSYK